MYNDHLPPYADDAFFYTLSKSPDQDAAVLSNCVSDMGHSKSATTESFKNDLPVLFYKKHGFKRKV